MNIDEIVIELGGVSEKTSGWGAGACEFFIEYIIPTSLGDPLAFPGLPCSY